ncbi:hypothetical protein BKA70DRAFT_1404573 [Coprinopsis sp. MPI-PUGE-AT-0042]|nr:hypothetical protein BKA70DRAFT_1404573 [Coprinopsis sp. MPI-PUGE-AT-0042]
MPYILDASLEDPFGVSMQSVLIQRLSEAHPWKCQLNPNIMAPRRFSVPCPFEPPSREADIQESDVSHDAFILDLILFYRSHLPVEELHDRGAPSSCQAIVLKGGWRSAFLLALSRRPLYLQLSLPVESDGALGGMTYYWRHRELAHGIVVCLMLWFCEFFHNLPTEVSFIWRAEWGLSKFLYLANRIVPLVFLPCMISVLLIRDPTPKQCQGLFGVVFVGDGTTIALAEAILCLRLYALSGCKRGMRIFLLVNWSAVLIWITVFLGLYIAKQPWNDAPQTPSVGGCRVVSFGTLPIYIVLVFAGILYNGIGMFPLVDHGVEVAEVTTKFYWGLSTTPFMRLFFRDGMIYFVGCTAMTILNAIGALSPPCRLLTPTVQEPYAFIFGPIQGIMHSILAARMVLLVKERARQEMGFSVATKGDISFRLDSRQRQDHTTLESS